MLVKTARQPAACEVIDIPVNIPEFELLVFDMINKTNNARVYDFSRKAKARIREKMVSCLSSVLSGLVDDEYIRGEFDRLFTYQAGYKGFLEEDGEMRSEWLVMQIPVFDGGAHQQGQSVVVCFDSLTHRTGPLQFTVRVRLGAIVRCVTNLPVSAPNASLPVIPYPPNPLNMVLNAPLMAYNHGSQGFAIPRNAFISAHGFYDVEGRAMLLF